MQTSVSGFSKTGLYPNNRHVIGEVDFAAAQKTERMPTDLAEAGIHRKRKLTCGWAFLENI